MRRAINIARLRSRSQEQSPQEREKVQTLRDQAAALEERLEEEKRKMALMEVELVRANRTAALAEEETNRLHRQEMESADTRMKHMSQTLRSTEEVCNVAVSISHFLLLRSRAMTSQEASECTSTLRRSLEEATENTTGAEVVQDLLRSLVTDEEASSNPSSSAEHMVSLPPLPARTSSMTKMDVKRGKELLKLVDQDFKELDMPAEVSSFTARPKTRQLSQAERLTHTDRSPFQHYPRAPAGLVGALATTRKPHPPTTKKNTRH